MRRNVGTLVVNGFRAVWPPQASSIVLPNLMPTLRAYSGVRVIEARSPLKPFSLGRIGTLEARLARKAKEVRRAQKLRYKVFYEERSAIADTATRLAGRDVDAFDAICDHILVLDHDEKLQGLRRKPRVVGTYRLLHQHIAAQHGGFYTANEFGIGGMLERHSNLRFLELGRSCVLPAYRNKRTVELLWHGVWSQVLTHRIDVMFGCASFEGTDVRAHAQALSFLHHFAAAPEEWRADALPSRRVPMNFMRKEAIDVKAALRELPPLIKGYLRLGAFVGRDAVVDHQFGTTDVLIVLPTAAISERYIQHFGPGAERHAA
jgi:putative hemolysin